MSNPMKVNDLKFKVTRPRGNTSLQREYNYLHGTVVTAIGIVTVYSQGSAGDRRLSVLTLVLNGVEYHRSINKRYSPRGLVTQANRFANEIASHDNQ
jgi:hypothetical protein